MDREAKEEYLVVIQKKPKTWGLRRGPVWHHAYSDPHWRERQSSEFAQSKWISCVAWASLYDVFIWIYILIFSDLKNW